MNNSNQIKPTYRWTASVKKLIPIVNLFHGRPQDENVQAFITLLEHHILHYGEDHAFKLFKAYRLFLQQIALKQNVDPIPFCKSSKGFPVILKPWEISVESQTIDKMYVMSFWRILEVFRCKPKYEVDSIIKSNSKDLDLIKDIKSFISTWKPIKNFKKFPGYLVMSNKAGPNGPCSISCLDDLKALRADNNLYNSIKRMFQLNGPNLDIDSYQAGNGEKHSKLVLLSDKACKTRIVAIADWWSNTALSGIHKSFMNFLRTLPSDVTFRQEMNPKLIKGLGPCLYSADMTAFTDAFPIELEEAIVEVTYGAAIAGLWKQIIQNRVFSHPKGDVKYASGNPMGLLSSWPVSTATHHAVKQYCAHQVLGNINHRYLMLGDDSIDTNYKVHKKYLEVMNLLGVSTSLSKCTNSEQGYAEFAKRLFTPEGEVTGLPITLLEELNTKPEQFIELLRICRERGYKDSSLSPAFELLSSNHKSGKMIADLLSLPESFLGMPPLLEVKPESWGSKFIELSAEFQNTLVTISRDYIFWEQVRGLDNPPTSNVKGQRVEVPENHPIVVALSEKLMLYLEHDFDDEFSIYNEWMKGNYREMAHVPNIDKYRYFNRGHKITKAKYDVIKSCLALANGNCNINLHKLSAISNFDLFAKGFPS